MSDEATGCMHGNANFWVAMAASCCFNLEYACISGNSIFFLSCIECLGSQQHRAAERGSIHAGFGDRSCTGQDLLDWELSCSQIVPQSSAVIRILHHSQLSQAIGFRVDVGKPRVPASPAKTRQAGIHGIPCPDCRHLWTIVTREDQPYDTPLHLSLTLYKL